MKAGHFFMPFVNQTRPRVERAPVPALCRARRRSRSSVCNCDDALRSCKFSWTKYGCQGPGPISEAKIGDAIASFSTWRLSFEPPHREIARRIMF